MCLFTEDDLFDILKDKELFARFILLEREEKILKLHILKGLTFEIIAGIEGVSVARVHQVYVRTIKKMKKQLLQILKDKSAARTAGNLPATLQVYIGGGGEVWNGV
jgi:DNA-directed RNA polymerase sigma subunit (sigma70/sigma32)